jgi:hypothetical protein
MHKTQANKCTNVDEIFFGFLVLRVGSSILQKAGASEDDLWK